MATVAESWVRAQQEDGEERDEGADWWACEAVMEADEGLDKAHFWRLILAVCEQTETHSVALAVGAGPLEAFVRKYEDAAMDVIEPELPRNRALLEALGGVWLEDEDGSLRARVDASLRRSGGPRY